MATITLNGVEVEAEDGRRLVEVIKEQGVALTNLCYLDGQAPYAGCRTCLVAIDDARPTPVQLSCTSTVMDGMVVNTETAELKLARQTVLSIIDANHPDRCLTCHRRVHCMPGDICLRDDVVTHRCLTCAKNYRCELQTANEILDMGEFEEPWVGETRTYYETPPPDPDRGNPFLEFDPQMCILCTRCERACADIRHTAAISLAGRGSTTRIAFGTGGAIHESDCDFCGACIDVCPTATLMEHPNKWLGRAEEWTSSVCNWCSVACTISYGTVDGRPVIVRPDRLNAVSRDQICVRGRFGYDAVGACERLTHSLVRRGDGLAPAPFDDAAEQAAEALQRVRRDHGAGAIAVLGSPLSTNEEAYLLAKLARDVIGTPHLDFSQGPVHRAVVAALTAGLGSDRLPASLTDIEQAQTIVVVAGDLEQSHPVAALRVRDAVVNGGARLVLVSPRWGRLVPFAKAWLQPSPGYEAAAVHVLAQAVAGDAAARSALETAGVQDIDALGDTTAPVPGLDDGALAAAIEAVQAGAAAEGPFAVLFAPGPAGAQAAAGEASACANLAVAARAGDAPQSLHYLPADANVTGIASMGVAPGEGGKAFPEIIRAVLDGEIRALLIHGDNPLLSAPGSARVAAALDAVDTLIVVDSLLSTAAQRADVVLAERPFLAKDGTITSADQRVVRQQPAAAAQGDERDGIAILSALANRLDGLFRYDNAAAVADEIAQQVPGYAPYPLLASGVTRVAAAEGGGRTAFQPLAAGPDPAALPDGALVLITGRPLYTSWEAASMRSDDADRLQREQCAMLNPRDAEAAGVRDGDAMVLTDGEREVSLTAALDGGIAPGTVYVPQYFDGGAVMALLPLGGAAEPEPAAARPPTVRVRALQPA